MQLARLARSLPITALALTGICTGCSAPLAEVSPRVSRDFLTGAARVRTLAVLPLDFSFTTGDPSTPETISLEPKLLDRVHRGVAAALARRGYQVNALLGPGGGSVDPRSGASRPVIHPQDLAALRVELQESTGILAPGPGPAIDSRVSANLTRVLLAATGAEASLYARGWVHVAHRESAGATAVKVIVAILLIAIVVGVILVLMSKSKSSSSGSRVSSSGFGSGRHHGGSSYRAYSSRSGSAAAHIVGHVALRTAVHVTSAAVATSIECRSCEAAPPPPPLPHEAGEPLPPPASAPASSPTTRRPPGPPPALYLRSGDAPEQDELGLAISLVENRSGRVLWHAAQRFERKDVSDTDIDALVEHFLKNLPPAR